MEDESWKLSLELLEKEYDLGVKSKGEIDERLFLNEENSLLGSGSLSGGAINFSGSKVSLSLFISICISYLSIFLMHTYSQAKSQELEIYEWIKHCK
jgi:retinoblastoma-like protein 1